MNCLSLVLGAQLCSLAGYRKMWLNQGFVARVLCVYISYGQILCFFLLLLRVVFCSLDIGCQPYHWCLLPTSLIFEIILMCCVRHKTILSKLWTQCDTGFARFNPCFKPLAGKILQIKSSWLWLAMAYLLLPVLEIPWKVWPLFFILKVWRNNFERNKVIENMI